MKTATATATEDRINHAPAPAAPTPDEARGRLLAARDAMRAGLIERDEEVDLALTGLVAGEHVLLVGPPGVAKSLLFDSLISLYQGPTFSVLLTKFTTPEEVLGPLSLASLKADVYRRVVDNRLPAAHLAMLDEVFKASSAILNATLRMLNEGVYEDAGRWAASPLRLCVGASNEWPNPEQGGAELGALLDRFTLRKTVRPIRTARGRERLLFGSDVGAPAPGAARVAPADVDAARAAAASVPWGADAMEALREVLRELAREGVVPSDRRQRKAVKVARASAFLAGAAEVAPAHMEALAHVLWDDPAEQPAKAAAAVARVCNPLGLQVGNLLVEAEEILAGIDARNLAQVAASVTKLGEIARKLKGLGPDPRARSAADYVAEEVKALRHRALDA
jgi:MoxR-like ATPase